jgi:peroxiredoxin
MQQAPVVNRLYSLVVNSALKDKVKFIGVGESDSAASLRSFKAAYQVPFPLVPDPDWDIGVDVFNIEGTPTTVVVDKRGTVLFWKEGLFTDAGRVFRELKDRLR